MAKDHSSNGRRRSRKEQQKHAQRIAKRRRAWSVTDDGAGARSIDEPKRHHRR